jgi:hypothetical protein
MIENENVKYKMNMKNITSNDEAMAKLLQKNSCLIQKVMK